MAMSLLGLLHTLPQHPSFDDSLARRYYARSHVKTVALVRPSAAGATLDTLDYTALDRAGYPVLTAKPDFKARMHLRYNRRHQLISVTKEAEPGFAWVVQADFDPATQTTITRMGPTLATLALYQTGHSSQHGKTSEYEAFLVAVPGLPAPGVSRILLSRTVVGGDTTRLDVLGYQGERVVQAESFYTIGREPQQRENGSIVLPTAGRVNQALEGRYIPNQRLMYNAAGWPVRTYSLPKPPQLASKPVTRTATVDHGDGVATMTTTVLNDSLTTIYQRNAEGQLLREEFRGKAFAGFGSPGNPPFNAYDYLPNGLRRSKTDNHGRRYEYRYTFY